MEIKTDFFPTWKIGLEPETGLNAGIKYIVRKKGQEKCDITKVFLAVHVADACLCTLDRRRPS